MAGLQDIQEYYRRLPDEKYGTLSKISHQHNILDVLYGGTGVQNPSPAWTYEISPGLMPVDQQHTGRCWIFSALEVHNHLFRNQYNITNGKATFSEAYIGFWDLFEKSRFFLQVALDTRDEGLDENSSLGDFFKLGIQDGGDYIFATNIMEKYGVVPSEFYPNRTYGTASTEGILTIINQVLRDDAVILRKTGDRRKIKPMMHNIFSILVLSFGLPPEPWKSLNWCIEQNEGYNYYAQEVTPEMAAEVGVVGTLPKPDVLDRGLEIASLDDEDESLSTVKVEKQLEEELEDPQLRTKERDKIDIVAPTNIEDECNEGRQCVNKFDRFFANLVRPPACNRGNQSCPRKSEEGGCEPLQKLVSKKKRRETDKKLCFNYTPIQFYKKFVASTKFIPLLCDPRYPKDIFLVMNDTNMLNGKEGRYFNVSMDDMAAYTVASLKMNIPVFFAADVKKEITPEGGKLQPDDESMEAILPEIHESPSQKDKINIYNAMATHAMVLTAVSLKQPDKPDWWRVVNSWGDIGARCGMYILSHKWFKRHVYSINIPMSLLSRKHVASIKKGETKCVYLDGSEAAII